MYSKAKEEEDNKIAEYLQKNGDGVLIFVSLRVGTAFRFLCA
jgi:reverse gyrase